jgi:hypothetical protein
MVTVCIKYNIEGVTADDLEEIREHFEKTLDEIVNSDMVQIADVWIPRGELVVDEAAQRVIERAALVEYDEEPSK